MTNLIENKSDLDLQYVLLPGKKIDNEYSYLYDQSYQFWHQTWSKTFFELKGLEKLPSDDFLRQDEITVLLNGKEIIGLFAYNFMDLNRPAHVAHSYFQTYPLEVIGKLKALDVPTVMSMGQLAVHPKWRKNSIGPFVSEALLGLATKRFLSSNASALIAFTRNNRKINDLVYRFGASALATGLKEHNVEVDLIAIYRENVRESPMEGVSEQVNRLWNSRKDFTKLSKELENDSTIYKTKLRAAS